MDFTSHDFEIRHRQHLDQLPKDQQTCHTQRMVAHYKLMDEVNGIHEHYQQQRVPDDLVPLYHAKLCKAYFLSQSSLGDMVGPILPSTLEPFLQATSKDCYRIMPSESHLTMFELILGHPPTMLKAMAFGIGSLGQARSSTPAMNAMSAAIIALEGNEQARRDTDAHLHALFAQPDFGVQELMWCMYILHGELVRTYRVEVGGEEIKQRRVYERINSHIDKAIQLQPNLPFAYCTGMRHAVASQDMDLAHARATQGLSLAQRLGDQFHTCLLANMVGYTIACGEQPKYTLGEIKRLFQLADKCHKAAKRYMHAHDFDAALAFRSLVDEGLEQQDEAMDSRVQLKPLLHKCDTMVEVKQGKFNCDKCGEFGQLKRCSKCKSAAYCSRACQVAHWKEHKKECCAASKDK